MRRTCRRSVMWVASPRNQVAEEDDDENGNETFNDGVDAGTKRKRSSRHSYSNKRQKQNRPTPVNEASSSSSSSWECLICTFVNAALNSSCQMCGQLKAVIRRDANEWECRQCTMVNPSTNRRCETCDAERRNDGDGHANGAAAAAASSSSVAAAAVPASSSARLIDMTGDLSTSPLPRRRSNRLEDNLIFLSGIEESFGRIDIDSHLLSLIANSIRSRWTLIETKFGGLHDGGSHIFQPSDITALLKTLVREACKKALQHAHTMELIIRMMEIERLEEVDGRCCKCHERGANVPLLCSENCFPAGEWRERHYICVKDAADYVMGLVDKKECGKIICPFEGCKKEVDMRFLKRCLNQSQFTAYSDACFHIATADSSHYQRCPTCNSLTEIVGLSSEFQLPKGGITLTDDSGKLLSEEAFRHYSEFRLRCHGPGCQTNFCTACRSVPYHMGFTCAQFKEYTESQHCRWCAEQLSESNIDISLANGLLVCKSAPCQRLKSRACQHLLPCRHPCFGVRDETNHPPCLEEGCTGNDAKIDGSGYCGICWVDELRSAPIVQLTSCPHAFHEHCVVEKIGKGKPFTRITFGFLDCPACKKQMSHPSEAIQKVLKPAMEFYDKVVEKAVARLKIENMLKDEKLISPTSRYYGNPQAYALDSFAYYNCFKCKKFYFGGRRDCEQNAQAENRPDEEFVCFDCADLKSVTCKVSSHREFQLWKCRFCCNPAVWFCFGTTHFCDPCHREAHAVMKRPKSSTKQCPGIERCPLKMKHSPNGPDKDCEFNIGCGVCTEKLTKKIAVQKSEEKVDEEIKKSKLLKNSSSSSSPSSGNSIFAAAANVFAGLGVSSIFASPAGASNPPAAAAAVAAAATASPKRTRSNSRRGRG